MDAHNLERGHIADEIVEVSASHPSEENIHHGSIVCRVERCSFQDANNSSREIKDRSASMRKLWGGIILCLIVMSIEVIFGARAHSLAILTDAAHMLSDVVAFAIALFSVWASGWQPTPRHSYGFIRIGILGALVSTLSIWGLTAYLQYEAVHRLIHIHGMHKVKGSLMFGIALAGLVVNILMMFIFGHGHGHLHGRDDVSVTTHQPNHHDNDHRRNINVQGAYLHVVGDLIQSIGVAIGAGIIWCKPKLKIIDPICTLLFSIMVLSTTIPMLRDILEVLMESTPRKIDATSLERGLCEMDEVVAIHELHIWAISVGKVLLSCHVRIRPEANADMVLHEVVDYIKKAHKIDHVTIQIERE